MQHLWLTLALSASIPVTNTSSTRKIPPLLSSYTCTQESFRVHRHTGICGFCLSRTFKLLKVPSGQIGSTWEWYHWISLEKDINRYRFLIFNFTLEYLKKPSKFWANLLLVRIMVCIEFCLPIGWRTVTWWKNPPKSSSFLVRIAEWWSSSLSSRNPKDNWCLSRIYGIRFGEKDHGLSACKPWTEQAGGLEAFLHGAAQNFELLLNIQDQK